MISYLPLAQLLKQRGITLSDLKKITGRDDGSLKIALCDGKYIKTSTLGIICKSLKCKISDVISWQPGEQKGLGKAKKVYVNWDLLSDSLEARGTNLTKISINLLKRSMNYLTGKRKDNKTLLYSELKQLATFCNKDIEQFICN